MWQLSDLQIDSSVIQIVQSDVLRNSVDTTAAITNTTYLTEVLCRGIPGVNTPGMVLYVPYRTQLYNLVSQKEASTAFDGPDNATSFQVEQSPVSLEIDGCAADIRNGQWAVLRRPVAPVNPQRQNRRCRGRSPPGANATTCRCDGRRALTRSNKAFWSEVNRSSRANEGEAVGATAARGESVTTETWGIAGMPEESPVARLLC